MKQLLLIFSLLSAINFNSQAQTLTYGAQAGIGISNVVKDASGDFTFSTLEENVKIYFDFNAVLSVKSAGFFGFSIEPGFAQKGNRFEYVSPVSQENTLRLNYLQLPILLDFYINDDICISLGPEFSFLTKATIQEGSNKFTIKDQNEDFEFSGLIGARFRITEHLSTGLRYNYGFSPVSEINFTDDNGQPLITLKSRNRYFQVFFRYTI